MRPTLKPYIQRNDSQYFKSWQPDSHYWTTELNPFVLFVSIWRVAAARSWKTHQQQISRLINWTNPTLTCAATYNETWAGSILNIRIAFDVIATIFIHVCCCCCCSESVQLSKKQMSGDLWELHLRQSKTSSPNVPSHFFCERCCFDVSCFPGKSHKTSVRWLP